MAGKELSVEVLSDDGDIIPLEQFNNDTQDNKGEVRQFDADAKDELQKYQSQAEENGRRAQELEQQLNEVVRFAQGTINENKRLAGLITSGEKMLITQAGGRVKAEQASAEAKFKKAYEDGDSAGMLDAQKEIARLANEDAQVKSYVPVEVTQPQPQQQPQPRQAPAVDAKSKGWIEKNAGWWMKDKPMTGFALGIHEELVRGGVTPGTDAYIKALDDRMVDAFPNKFQNAGGQAPRQRSAGMTVVAPVTRSVGGKSTGKVQITQSMATMARRLGVPVQAYAEELQRMNQNVE